MMSDGAIGRRALLAEMAALAAVPARAADADAAVRARLDALASLPGPTAKRRALADVSEAGLSPGVRLDLTAAREGLAIDARLAELLPTARPGRGPYTVTPGAGAWRDPKAPDAADRIARDTRAIADGAARGVVLPAPLLDKTVAAIERAASGASPAVAAALADQAATLRRVRPLAGAPGLWRLPNGAAAFALLVDRQFGPAGAGDALHRRLLAELEPLTARADVLTAQLGYRSGSVGERIVAAFRDPAFLYPDSEAGCEAAVADMNRWLGAARTRVPALIGAVPAECGNVTARRMTPAEEAAGKAGYRTLPKADGTPGAYVVDLRDIRRRPRWSLASVAHHELIPGHMIQMPIEARAAPHPLRLDYAAAWQEGWAIHAEQLMATDDDRLALGQVHWLLFRVARALLDTGIHTQRWSIAEARARVQAMMGEPAYFASFDQDVERVCLEPGVRAGEALAWLALRDAAARARDRRAFHQAVLVPGRMRRSSLAAITAA